MGSTKQSGGYGIAAQAFYDGGCSGEITVTLAEAIADLKGVDQKDLLPLSQQINTEALNSIFCRLKSGGNAGIGQVSFVYEGLFVEVNSTGEIRIYEIDHAPGAFL